MSSFSFGGKQFRKFKKHNNFLSCDMLTSETEVNNISLTN